MGTFERDDKLLAEPSATVAAAIETSGAYTGMFKQAKERIAKTGTKGIEFTFEANSGEVARYLTLWIERANGDRIPYAYGLLSGLMVCLGLKSIASSPDVSEEWDASLGTQVPTKIEAYPDLIKREIGIVLQRVDKDWEGRTRTQMNIVEFFNPSSRQVPSEMLAGTGATGKLDFLIGNLKEKIVDPVGQASVASRPSSNGRVPNVNLDDEDIPF